MKGGVFRVWEVSLTEIKRDGHHERHPKALRIGWFSENTHSFRPLTQPHLQQGGIWISFPKEPNLWGFSSKTIRLDESEATGCQGSWGTGCQGYPWIPHGALPSRPYLWGFGAKFGEVTRWDSISNRHVGMNLLAMCEVLWFDSLTDGTVVFWICTVFSRVWMRCSQWHIFQQASLKLCNLLLAHMSRNNMWFDSKRYRTLRTLFPFVGLYLCQLLSRIIYKKKLLANLFYVPQANRKTIPNVYSHWMSSWWIWFWPSRRYEKSESQKRGVIRLVLAPLCFFSSVCAWPYFLLHTFCAFPPQKKIIMAAMDFFVPWQARSHSRATRLPVAVGTVPEPAPPCRSHTVCRNGLVLGLVAASRRWSKRTRAVGFGVQEAWRMADGLLLGVCCWQNDAPKIRE